MSSAGQGNEAGSVFRRNAATYFAVHALIGIPVEALQSTRHVLRIDFETTDPTDDIVLSLAGGVKAYVSAKNHVDAGKSFKDTVTGWIDQLDAGVGQDDLLGLTFEKSAAWVEDLAEGLERLRAGQPVTRTAELKALKKLDDLVPIAQRDEVRRRARLLRVARSSVNNDTQTELLLLLRHVVDGDAFSALSAIQSGLHTLAGSASGADVEALVTLMADAGGVSVRLGGDSPAAVEAETRLAMQEYLDVFLEQKGRVNLPLLAEDLEPLVVDGLYESLRVIDPVAPDGRESPQELDRLVRRRRRALLVGQPGSGKSVAAREIAAACAGHVDAPVPVFIHLPDLLPLVRERDLKLADIVDLGIRRGTPETQQLLKKRLMERASVGDVMLVLDSLDECRAEAPVMADHLKRLLDGLHPHVGVVLATRASAELAAQRLELARLDLQRPSDLDSTMDSVLDHCAQVRVADGVRTAWLAARRLWINEVLEAQAGLVEVPQLALLVVLIVAESSEPSVPQERAELLHRAVVRSVERWELVRFIGPELAWASDLTPLMMLDGFQILGGQLDTVETVSKKEALTGLRAMLTGNRWSLSGGRAEELAEQILIFWDEHVSVFTVDKEADVLVSRSRVFTEVATAMWTKTCDAPALEAWAASALEYNDSDGVLGLALGLNPDLIQTLLGLGEADPDASSTVAAAIRNGTIALKESDMLRLFEQLLRYIEDAMAGNLHPESRKSRSKGVLAKKLAASRQTDSRTLVNALCELPLPSALQVRRRAFISKLALSASDTMVLNAWVVLTEAATEGRSLAEDEVELVQGVIDLDIPPSRPLIEKSRRRVEIPAGRSVPPGLISVAFLAVRHLEVLAERSAESIFRLSMRGTTREHRRINHALREAGINVSPWFNQHPLMKILSQLSERDYTNDFLLDIASLHDGEDVPPLTKIDRWSLKEVGDLVFATGYATVSMGSFESAFDSDIQELRTAWLECVAIGYGIDVPTAAAQARHLLNQPDSKFNHPHDWSIVTAQPHYALDSVDPDPFTAGQQDALIEALGAYSDWIAWNAADLLVQTKPQWDTEAVFKTDRSQWTPHRAMLFHVVAILASPDSASLLQQASGSDDPAYRQASELAVRVNNDLDPDGDIARKLAVDEDLTVRGPLDSGDPPPHRWSCNWCGNVNEIEVVDCASCENGTRPDMKKSAVGI